LYYAQKICYKPFIFPIKLQTSVTAVEPPCSRPTKSNGQYQKAYHIRFDFPSLAALK
jgi:hypothetical protein